MVSPPTQKSACDGISLVPAKCVITVAWVLQRPDSPPPLGSKAIVYVQAQPSRPSSVQTMSWNGEPRLIEYARRSSVSDRVADGAFASPAAQAGTAPNRVRQLAEMSTVPLPVVDSSAA